MLSTLRGALHIGAQLARLARGERTAVEAVVSHSADDTIGEVIVGID